MTTYEDIYNSLPTVFDADKQLSQIDRDAVFSKLAPVLAKYQYQFDICLIHAHCKVEHGERMIEVGNITQPEDAASFGTFYPDKWLSTGEPFEFTSTPTSDPPPELFTELSQITGGINVLGLHFAGTPRKGRWVERTEGRRNIWAPDTGDVTPGFVRIKTRWLPRVECDGTVSVIDGGDCDHDCTHHCTEHDSD